MSNGSKIILFGHGYIGTAIAATLQNNGIDYLHLHHGDKLPKAFNSTAIINAAGYTGVPNVDKCEFEKRATIQGNVLWPLALERQADGLPVLHISSGCVYTGYKDGGWTEDDVPNFDFQNGSFYSGSKALAQELLAPYLTKSYLFRVRMPFGVQRHPKNYLDKIESYKKLVDVRNSFSCVSHVASAVVFFASTLPKPGIYNVCNHGAMSTREIADMAGLKPQWFTEEEFKASTIAPRSNCILNTDKLTRVYELPNIAETMRSVIHTRRTAL